MAREALDSKARRLLAGACTCADFTDDIVCGCRACPERATAFAGCPHRLDQVLSGQSRNDRLYDGLCDGCFEHAREVRDCGLRVAEHAGAACRRAVEHGSAAGPEPVEDEGDLADDTPADIRADLDRRDERRAGLQTTPFDDLDPDSDLAAFVDVVGALKAAGLKAVGVEVYDNDDPRLARPRRRIGDGGAAWRSRWSVPSSVLGGSE
jgi:hypothetical protein